MEQERGLVKIETEAGEVTLSPNIIRKYLVNGNGTVSDQEVMMFMALCKYQRLNPFLREAYLVKYGNQQATIITGKEAFLKRAMTVKDLEGFKAGVIVQKGEDTKDTQGMVPSGFNLVGGWAEVHKRGWAFPLRVEVSFNEYVGRKGDGSVNSMWTAKPATMIRKVALVQALREAFPVDLAGMFSPEEINSVQGDLPHAPIDITPQRDPGKEEEFWLAVESHGLSRDDARIAAYLEETAKFYAKQVEELMQIYASDPAQLLAFVMAFRKKHAVVQQEPPETEDQKQKRHRRTKLEMERDNQLKAEAP